MVAVSDCLLYYSGGIAGEEAKSRFKTLHIHFYTKFFMPNSSEATENMKRLQDAVDKIGVPDNSVVVLSKARHGEDQILSDILHRVFYYMHV